MVSGECKPAGQLEMRQVEVQRKTMRRELRGGGLFRFGRHLFLRHAKLSGGFLIRVTGQIGQVVFGAFQKSSGRRRELCVRSRRSVGGCLGAFLVVRRVVRRQSECVGPENAFGSLCPQQLTDARPGS